MGRPVTMRPSYRTDAGYLLRLEDAILKDNRQPESWRTRVAGKVRQVALDLLGVEAEAGKQAGLVKSDPSKPAGQKK